MLEGKSILVIGARAGGYGASIAQAAVEAGARVFGTSLNPSDPKEQSFFKDLGIILIDIPLRYSFDQRQCVFEDLSSIEAWLRAHHVTRLDAVIHTVAGGFPRQPSVMKAVGDILKGKTTFSDMATAVRRNVYYVNAISFQDTVRGLSGLTDRDTQFIALTYRGDLPYFISQTKKCLEQVAVRLAREGKRTLVAALPEAWTQSSQFFTGIEIAVLHNYLGHLQGRTSVSDDLAPAFSRLEGSIREVDGLPQLVEDLDVFRREQWARIKPSSDISELSVMVQELFARLRREGSFPVLRRSVEIISDFVRDASGFIVVREFIDGGRYQAGDVRQVYYSDLLGNSEIGIASPREKKPAVASPKRVWHDFGKDEVRKTLKMYGPSFLFVDRVVMEMGDLRDGMIGFGSFTVPTPDENPIMKDHFVGMPLFGGHLQMEAVAQFGTFMLLKILENQKVVPILTGTEFPDLNTMAPPGEKLRMKGTIRVREKRNLTLEAWIENRFARSKGTIRGMLLSERVVRKMMSSFDSPDSED
jgi:3-hydroxymyristoyl/3-hydroxydecanoyl-(acyl carrier protein) dehydratase